MDIDGRRKSSNIEDRRGMRPVRTGVGLSLGGVLVLVVLSFMGVDVRPFLGMAVQQQEEQPPSSAPDQPYQESAQETKLRELTAVVLADTEDAWTQILPRYGVQYVPPTLVLFSGMVKSACGMAESASGPFYCPLDQKVYIDMSFYNDLSSRFGAPGDFARGLRDRARGRPPCAEPARHIGEGPQRAAAIEQGRRQCIVGAPRAAG